MGKAAWKTLVRPLVALLFLVAAFSPGFTPVFAADCALTNAYWPGPITTGTSVRVLVSGSNCKGYKVALNIYQDIFPAAFIKGAEITFNSDTQADGLIPITVADFQKINPSIDTISIYFTADAGNSTAKSNSINLTCPKFTWPGGCTSSGPAGPSGPAGGSGGGTAPTSGGGAGSGGSSGGGSKTVSFDFSIPNPLKAKDLTELIGAISQWLFTIAIPIAVIMIIWGGVRFLWARGNETEVSEAKKILKYAIIGLAVIFIGKGFVTLIQSILELGGTGSSPTTQQPGSGTGTGTGGSGSGPSGPTIGGNGREGNACSVNADCASGYICHLNICQFPDGNTLGDRCNGNGNCAKDMWCNNRDPDALRVIDGQTLGLCALPGGDHYPCVSDADCVPGSYFCDTTGGYGCKSKTLR